MDRNGAKSSHRNSGIDLMRAVLVLGVMAFHYTIRWTPPDFPYDILGYDSSYSRHWAIGSFGVQMFFVISGYVITLSVLRADSAPRFAASRFLRIYPAFMIAALGAFVVPRLFGPWQLRSSPIDLLMTLLLVPTEFGARYTDGAFWTLGVEAKFYFYVFVGFLLARHRFWIVLAILGVTGPLVYRMMPGLGDKLLIAPYIGFFLIGMSAWYAMNAQERMPAFALGCSGLFAWAMNFNAIAYDGTVSYLTHGLLLIGTIFIFLLAHFNQRLRLPPLGFIGGISYELYLVHQVPGISLIARIKASTAWPDAICMIITAAVMVVLALLLQHWLSPSLRRAFVAVFRWPAAIRTSARAIPDALR